MYIQSIDGDQYNQILALLENCNLDNATGDVINEIVENLNKIYIWVLEKNDQENQTPNRRYDSKPCCTNVCHIARA